MRRPNRRVIGSLFVIFSVCAPRASAAQVVVLDEGTFSLFVDGSRIGREDFSIRRAPSAGATAYIAQGSVSIGETRLTVALSTDSAGTPLRFQLESTSLGQATQNITGEWRRGLWSARAVNPGGESAREFRLPQGSVAAADGVVHHQWFLLTFGRETGTVQVLPRSMALRAVRVESAGTETISIDLRNLEARKWVVRSAEDGTVLSEAWTDSLGRLLRIRIPAEDIDATRDEPPR